MELDKHKVFTYCHFNPKLLENELHNAFYDSDIDFEYEEINKDQAKSVDVEPTVTEKPCSSAQPSTSTSTVKQFAPWLPFDGPSNVASPYVNYKDVNGDKNVIASDNHDGHVVDGIERKQCSYLFASQHLSRLELFETFIEYGRLVYEHEKLDRLAAVESGQLLNVKQSYNYTDQDFMLLFTEMYGPIEVDNWDSMMCLFESFKRARLEQLQEMEDQENLALQLREESKEQQHEFSFMNGEFSPKLPAIAIQLEKVHAKLQFVAKEKEKFHLDDMHEDNMDWLLLSSVRPSSLILTLNNAIDQEAWASIYDNSPFELEKFSPSHLETESLLLPSFYFNCVDALDFERLFWHQLLVVMAINNGELRLVDVDKVFKQLFGLGMNIYKNMFDKMSTEHEFILNIQRKYYKDIELHPKTVRFVKKKNVWIQETYLYSNAYYTLHPGIMNIVDDQSPELLNQTIHRKAGFVESTSICLPQRFAQLGDKPINISDQISNGAYLRCVVWWIINPGPDSINVILSQCWNKLEKFQTHIDKKMKKFLKEDGMWAQLLKLNRVNVRQLFPELCIMVRSSSSNDNASSRSKEKEWFRAVVQKVDYDLPMVYARLLDYGNIQELAQGSPFSFMNKNLLNEYPAQAIECKLNFDKLDENCQYNWPCETYSKLCKELKGENSVGIHFIKRIIEKDAHKQKKIKWLVTINKLVRRNATSHTTFINETDVKGNVALDNCPEDSDFACQAKLLEYEEYLDRITDASMRCQRSLNRFRIHGEYLSKVEYENISNLFYADLPEDDISKEIPEGDIAEGIPEDDNDIPEEIPEGEDHLIDDSLVYHNGF